MAVHGKSTSARLKPTPYDDPKVLYFGGWLGAADQPVKERRCRLPFHACMLAFKGPVVRWLGSRGPDHGQAEVWLDSELESTVDAYAPRALPSQVLFEKQGLDADRIHTLRIVVTRESNPEATDRFIAVERFESAHPVDYPTTLSRAAKRELRAIVGGTKPFLAPETWKPVSYSASEPMRGVTLGPGVLRDCFDRNITYLNRCFSSPYYNDGGNNGWVQALPASGEGRMLAGAGHSLRWGERADMRGIVDTIVARVKARQRVDGYCLPYDDAFMEPQKIQFTDERRNYDRVNLTRGMVAAGLSGTPDAYAIMRRFYDWLNHSPYYPQMLAGNSRGSAANCNNGHAGGLLMHASPVGTADDLVAVERCFVQDFFIDQAIKAEPLSLAYYPLHTPHSYVLLAFEAWLDHYVATGAEKYLKAANGAWHIVKDWYMHVGGTIAICEQGPGDYPPGSYYIGAFMHTGETCGSVFWADFNHRFLRLYPGEERYAAEIEKVILNVMLAVQAENGSIRYHSHLHGAKEDPQCANTCCEVMGVPFIARLPQYLYSIDGDGVHVNLFAASAITWQHRGQDVRLETTTDFPCGGRVSLRISVSAPTPMRLRVRVPSWATGNVRIDVNGAAAATGAPGTFAVLDRTWSGGDTVAFDLPMAFRLSRYSGLDQSPGRERFALEYGPVLLALTGAHDLDVRSDALPGLLKPIAGSPLHFSIEGHPGCRYLPYWQIQTEGFTCFPTLR